MQSEMKLLNAQSTLMNSYCLLRIFYISSEENESTCIMRSECMLNLSNGRRREVKTMIVVEVRQTWNF